MQGPSFSATARRITPYAPPAIEHNNNKIEHCSKKNPIANKIWCVAMVILVVSNILSLQSSLSSLVPNLRCDVCTSSLSHLKEGIAAAAEFAAASRFSSSSKNNNNDNGPNFDILSIGSLARPELLMAQQRTFASHVSVRRFVNATERDDADQNCLVAHDPMAVSRWCRGQPYSNTKQKFLRRLTEWYAKPRWLASKKNPTGWMCAQPRPLQAFHQLVKTSYQSSSNSSNATAADLPDYLIIMDDDTYYNMEDVSRFLQEDDPDIPRAIVGCLVRDNQAYYSFPIGGFGLILSRGKLKIGLPCCKNNPCFAHTCLHAALFSGALRNFMKPINCAGDGSSQDEFVAVACRRLSENRINENQVVEDGMSVADMMGALATAQPYSQLQNWTRGFCFHSDWLWGYFINFYEISIHFENMYKKSPERLLGYNGSEMGSPGSLCRNSDLESCDETKPICHYQTPESMESITSVSKERYPGRFKTP